MVVYLAGAARPKAGTHSEYEIQKEGKLCCDNEKVSINVWD